jgi:hypothetical protein
MVNTYITPFIQKYGTRDGIILSELCKKEYESWKKGLGFCKQDCENVMPFLTTKQIRDSVDTLLKNGCLERLPSNASLDRTIRYRINPEVFNNYMKTLLENKEKGNV